MLSVVITHNGKFGKRYAGAHPFHCAIAGEHKRLRQLVGIMTESAASARAPFDWADGPLVTAMRQGDIILIDELNLAEDAVLERLNRSGCATPF